MTLTDSISIYFNNPAIDPLGKKEVVGKIRFLERHVEINWRLKGSVFTGGQGETETIDFPYSEVESVELKKKWFKVREIILRVGNPQIIQSIPSLEIGKLCLVIDDRSMQEVKKLARLIDFKKSEFILDEYEKRINFIKESE